ncbi:MAG: hypothetical protein QXQ37_02240 [Nitrososphaerota archaeon]
MSGLSSVIVGGMVLLILTMSCFQVLMLVRNEAAELNDLQRINNAMHVRKVLISGFKLLNITALLNVSFVGRAVALSELRRSDIFVGCVCSDNSSRFFLMGYGADWRIVDVSFMNDEEILNPSNPELMSGWVDQGEVASIEIRIPDSCDLSRAVVLVFVSPDGEVGVAAGRGGI